MESKEILEGNKLIAEFMGAEYERKKDFFNPEIMREFIYFMGIPHMNYKDKECRHQYTPATCGYHYSWDWLIPVCQKIFSKECQRYESDSIWPYIRSCQEFKRGLLKCDINMAFNGVINFIKWHNESLTKEENS